jgi:hypothetical protein
MQLPKYPIYIPSKGRPDKCLTAKCLNEDGVPFYLVVEPQEAKEYAVTYGDENLLTLPFSNTGSAVAARNWIKEHATQAGHKRHWQIDDDIKGFFAWTDASRQPCVPSYAIATCEEFVDRYSNVAIAGLKSHLFGSTISHPFTINCQAFTCVLVLNDLPYSWRGIHGHDTDFSLQVLTGGWCTILFHAFQFEWSAISSGGNESVYKGDGRLRRARELQRRWPGLVKLIRQSGRPSPNLARTWNKFDTPLERIKS